MEKTNEKQILVIDDEKQIRTYLSKVLQRGGYQVTVCRDGVEGIAKFRQGTFDVVITDILMPNRDGIDTIISLRQIDSEIKIIAISGAYRSKTLLDIANVFNINASLQKPFENKEILGAVAKVIMSKSKYFL